MCSIWKGKQVRDGVSNNTVHWPSAIIFHSSTHSRNVRALLSTSTASLTTVATTHAPSHLPCHNILRYPKKQLTLVSRRPITPTKSRLHICENMVTFALPESPASDVSGPQVSNQEAVGPKQEQREQQHRPHAPSTSPPRFIFNKEKARDTWRTPAAAAHNQIRIVVERKGYANGDIVCDRINPDLLFKSVPALRRRLEDRQIFLPTAACLNEETVESMVYELVSCAKDGTSVPVPEHVLKDPVSMIRMHCVLVFFELKQEAEEFRSALWKLFASVHLNHADMLWIWDTFSGHVRSDLYTAPFADEYVQMMAWRILTLDKNIQLDPNIRRHIASEKEPKYLTETIETRLMTHGLGMNPLAYEVSENPSQPSPTALANKMDSEDRAPANMAGSAAPTRSEQDSGGIFNSTISLNLGQQDLAITSKVEGQDTKADPSVKAGMKRPSSTNDTAGEQKRVMKGSDGPELAPSTSPFSFNRSGVTDSRMNAMTSVPAAGSSLVSGFGRTGNTESAQSASLGIVTPVPSSPFHILGKSGQSPAQSVVDSSRGPKTLNTFGTAQQVTKQSDSMDTTTIAALPSSASAANSPSTTPLRNSGSSGPFGSNTRSFGASAAANRANSLSTDLTHKQMQMQQANGEFATMSTPMAAQGPLHNTGSKLFGTQVPNVPGTGNFTTPLGSSMNNARTFGVTGDHASTPGATSNPFASSNSYTFGQGLTRFSPSVNTSFSRQSQPADANLFPNAGFGAAVNNPNQADNPFNFQPPKQSGNGSGARNNGGRLIKKATGVRGSRRQG